MILAFHEIFSRHILLHEKTLSLLIRIHLTYQPLNRYDVLVGVAILFIERSVINTIVNAECPDKHVFSFRFIQEKKFLVIF